jgi:hypothetical protein
MVKKQSHAAGPLYKGNAEKVIKMVVDLPVASIRMVTMAIQIVTAGKQIFRFTAQFQPRRRYKLKLFHEGKR